MPIATGDYSFEFLHVSKIPTSEFKAGNNCLKII